jgi:hypothetical protein
LNRDGQDDLVTANSGTNTVSVLLNLGVGANFQAATNFIVGTNGDPHPGPLDLAIADINRDGRMDFVVANFNENTVSVLTNRGGGIFGGLTNYAVGVGPVSVRVADMNNDGSLDIITANRTDGTLTILLGNTNGAFGAAQTITLFPGGDPQPKSLFTANLRGGNVTDLVVANYNSNSVSVLLGSVVSSNWVVQSQGNYDAGLQPTSLIVRDLNHDAIPDIAAVNSGDDNVEVLLGEGDGTFFYDTTYPVGANPVAIAGSNFNNDNATDLAVVNAADNTVSLLINSEPLAYDFTQVVNEDAATVIPLRGALQGGGGYGFQIDTDPTNGTLVWISTNLVYLSDTNYYGPDHFSYVSFDSNTLALSSVAVVSLTVVPVNDAPSFALAAGSVTVMEDAAVTNIPAFAIDLSAGPDNESGQALSFVVTNSNNALFRTQPKIGPTGTLTFRPAPNATGTATVAARIKDNGGVLRGGTNQSPAQTFTITVTPNPLKPVRGTYNGLYYEAGGVRYSAVGFFTFNMAANGLFTGSLVSESGRDAFGGRFNLSGAANVHVARANNSALDLGLQLDLTNGTDEVTGSVTNASWIADLSGDRAVFNALTNPAPQAGLYTMIIPGGADAALSPAGDSYATLTVASNGSLRATGRLADDSAISQTVSLSKHSQWPFYARLYSGGQGVAVGWLLVTNHTVSGPVTWIKTPLTSKYYPGGFTNDSSVIGSSYANVSPVLAMTNCLLIASGGNLSAPLTNSGVFTATNTVLFGGSVALKLAVPASGTASGVFIHPSLKSPKALKGVVLPQQNTARGYFVGTNQSGAFLLQNNP